MATKIQIKRGTKANLPALSPGEFGLTTDTEELYIGGNSGNIRLGKNGESSTPNATATHSGGVVAITAPAGVNLISFYAPSDFSGDDTYTVNGSAVTLTDLNGNAIYDGWKEGAPVQLILKGAQAFFKSGGGVNDTLPPLNPNMTGELADGVFTVTADKLPVAQADALAGAEWYYADHVPARPGDGTKVEFTREQLVISETPKALSEYVAGDIVKIKENNAAAEFIVAMHNYESSLNGEGRTLLVRKDIYDLRAWDAALQKIYSSSDIDDFANTGYKNQYSAFVQGLMGTTKFPCMSQRGGSVVTIEKSVFILSMTEYGKTHHYAPVEGSALAIAENLLISDYNGEPTDHYTRTITTNDNTSVWRINDTGGNNYSSAEKEYGFRPCFTIPSTTEFGSVSNELIEDATAGVQTLADVQPLSGESISDEGSTVTLSIPWTESGYCYCRQFPYNSKHQYQTQLVGAVATNDPDYGQTVTLDPVLANNSWDAIAYAAENGLAADTWQVGDTIDIIINSQTVTAEIVGFDHDGLADGSGTAGITFGLKNLMDGTKQMNGSNTNLGGFTGTSMFTWLEDDVLTLLPADLQAVIKSVNKLTQSSGGSNTISTDAMKLFLFSEIEIFGTTTHSYPGEGTQYPRFATAESRIKYLSNGTGSVYGWWERSPNGYNNFCVVNTDGSTGYSGARNAQGVCFGFCV